MRGGGLMNLFDLLNPKMFRPLAGRNQMILKTTILRQGDTLVIKSLDRLSRNKGDIKSASFANEQYRSQEGKATRKRNSYQKVIICA